MIPDLTEPLQRAAVDRAVDTVRALPESDPVRRAAQARRLIGDRDLATAALAQAGLRERARVKFGPDADRMYFTPDGLEQASRREVAEHRASRFAWAGMRSVLDLCCGIGADALALARAGLHVVATDADPDTVRVARANAAVLLPSAAVDPGIGGMVVHLGRAEDADLTGADAVFLDPARRAGARRTFDPSGYSPPWSFVRAVLTSGRPASAKLGPGIDHGLIPADVEAEWVSVRGEVKEAALWSAGLSARAGSAGLGATAVRRRASLLPAGVELTDLDPSDPALGGIGEYLLEPDGAIIRAGLVQQAAAALGAHRIDPHLAYLSGDRPASGPLGRSYRVLDVLPYSVSGLRTELRRRGVGRVEIKKRGVDVDPAELRRRLAPSGPAAITVLLARVGDDHLAVLAEPG